MYMPTFCTVLAVYIRLYVVQCCCQYMYVHMYGNVYSTVLGQVQIDKRLKRTV